MEKTEEKKTNWWKIARKAAIGITIGALAAYGYSKNKEVQQLKEELSKMRGAAENIADQNIGLQRTIEKLSYWLGRCRRY